MNLKEIVWDSLRYAASDWKMLILLGLVILIADLINEIPAGPAVYEIEVILIITGGFFGILEAGYLFRIIEQSVNGETKLPRFNKLGEMFSHGFKEIFVTSIYFLIPLTLIGEGNIVDLDINILAGYQYALVWLGLILIPIIYLFYQAAILNMAHHHGNIRSAFDFDTVFKKTRKIGSKRLLFVAILTVIIVYWIKAELTDTLTTIPVIGMLISELLVLPYLMIFTSRILGLIDET